MLDLEFEHAEAIEEEVAASLALRRQEALRSEVVPLPAAVRLPALTSHAA